MAFPKPIILTRQQQNYLRRHYQHTKNDELVATLGISHSSLHRLARKMGLHKSRQFIRRCQAESTAIMKEVNSDNGYYFQQRYARKQWQEYREQGTRPSSCFKPGVSSAKRLGAKKEQQRLLKSHQSRRETLERDKRRVRLGLQPFTRIIKECKLSRKQISIRHNMKKRGYIVFRTDADSIYYDQNTSRSPIMERHAVKLEFFIRDISQYGTTPTVTVRADSHASWCDL